MGSATDPLISLSAFVRVIRVLLSPLDCHCLYSLDLDEVVYGVSLDIGPFGILI